MTQLPLPLPQDPELRFVQVCHLCGDAVAAVPVANGRAGGRWSEAVLWCYVAQKEHERAVHGT